MIYKVKIRGEDTESISNPLFTKIVGASNMGQAERKALRAVKAIRYGKKKTHRYVNVVVRSIKLLGPLLLLALGACGGDQGETTVDAGSFEITYFPDGGIDCARTTYPTIRCSTKGRGPVDHGS